VHEWPEPDIPQNKKFGMQSFVSQLMEKDVFSVQENDPIEFVAELMDWRKIRFTPVEDAKGNLLGLVSIRLLLRHYVKKDKLLENPPKYIKDIMIKDLIVAHPGMPLSEAAQLMQKHQIGCLPVVENGKLQGMLVERDFTLLQSL